MGRLVQVIGCIATLGVVGTLSAQSGPATPRPPVQNVARTPARPDASTLAGTAACTASKVQGSLGFVVDSATLMEFERRRGSLYINAFLVGLFAAQSGSSDHPYVKCARAFVDTPLGDFRQLRPAMLSSNALIAALREEQVRVRESARLVAGSGQTLSAVVGEVRRVLRLAQRELVAPGATSSSLGMLGAALEAPTALLRAESEQCKDRAVCRPLSETVAHLTGLSSAVAAYTVASERFDRRERELNVLEVNARRDSAQAEQNADAKNRAMRALAEIRAAQKGLRGDTLAVRERREKVDESLARTSQAASALQSVVDQDAQTARAVVLPPLGTGDVARSRQAQIVLPRPDAVAPTVEARSPDLTVALVDFVVERAKQELIYAFIANLDSTFRHSTTVRSAFPTTSQLLRRSVSSGKPTPRDVAQVGLPVWRAALVSDLQRLPLHALESADTVCLNLDDSKVASCLDRARSLQLAARLGEEVVGGSPVLRTLESWEGDQRTSLSKLPPQLLPALRVASQLVALSRAQGYVVPTESGASPLLFSAQSLTHASDETRKAFARLLIVPAAASFDNRPIDEAAFTAGLLSMTERIERLAQPAGARGDAPGPSAGFLAREVLMVVSDAADLGRTIAIADADRTRLANARDDIRLLSSAVDAFLSASYSDALVHTLELLDNVRGATTPPGLMKMTALAASLADARSQAQVLSAFETAASPIGGWQGKAVGDVKVTISAYPGFGVGYETVVGEDLGAGLRSSLTMGVSLPIGFDFVLNPRMREPGTKPNIRSLGVLLAPLDLGAVLSYRFDTSDPVTNEPQESFRQVFAPGVFLSAGLTSKWPLTMLAGWQFLPAARTVDAPSGPERRSATRWMVSFAVDVVLFELR